jgi:hypothetical protein
MFDVKPVICSYVIDLLYMFSLLSFIKLLLFVLTSLCLYRYPVAPTLSQIERGGRYKRLYITATLVEKSVIFMPTEGQTTLFPGEVCADILTCV